MSEIRLRHVTKRYGSFTALDDVSVELEENTIHGLLGRNGAGKTTIMQILTGQGFETSGEVEVFGEHPYENAGVPHRPCHHHDRPLRVRGDPWQGHHGPPPGPHPATQAGSTRSAPAELSRPCSWAIQISRYRA